ncbi:hypothetical protein CEXT_406871 [Caerostris extrusa]|uniref:Uncharacterized protein n=1 Tax=Caerostris extrusa TaxID=172846 RepID=A0AAV4XV06_CAEEX|nr:hypothetical protein CEXT_406871 [Caerostris extrusa]
MDSLLFVRLSSWHRWCRASCVCASRARRYPLGRIGDALEIVLGHVPAAVLRHGRDGGGPDGLMLGTGRPHGHLLVLLVRVVVFRMTRRCARSSGRTCCGRSGTLP